MDGIMQAVQVFGAEVLPDDNSRTDGESGKKEDQHIHDDSG